MARRIPPTYRRSHPGTGLQHTMMRRRQCKEKVLIAFHSQIVDEKYSSYAEVSSHWLIPVELMNFPSGHDQQDP